MSIIAIISDTHYGCRNDNAVMQQQHKKFLDTNLQKLLELSKAYPYINFKEELVYFKS